MSATTTTPPNGAATFSELERALKAASNELAEEVQQFAEIVHSLSKDLRRSEQFALLRGIGSLGARLNAMSSEVCKQADANDRRGGR